MSPRRAWSLFAALVVMSPLAAFAVPVCQPGPHCPMAGAAAGGRPCHGAAIQSRDCCLAPANPAAVEAVPVVAPADAGAIDAVPPPQLGARHSALPPAPVDAPPPPLYRLFRTLLI